MEDILNRYFGRAGVMPDRVVIHKTSGFAPDELKGFSKAAKNRVATLDYVWLRPTSIRIVRKGLEEPWRRTLCTLSEQFFLFTSGYIPWWNEYPRLHIPAPAESNLRMAESKSVSRAVSP